MLPFFVDFMVIYVNTWLTPAPSVVHLLRAKKTKKPIRDGAGDEQHFNFIYIVVMREKYIGHAYSIRETNSFDKVKVKQIALRCAQVSISISYILNKHLWVFLQGRKVI